MFLVKVIRNLLGAELKVTEKVANDPRQEGRAQCKGGPSAKRKINFKKNEKKPAGCAALKVATSCQFLKQARQLLRMLMQKSTWEVQGNQPN